MFHVERDIIRKWLETRENIPPDFEEKALIYARLVFNENRKFNLTGHETLVQIVENLVIGSIDPLCDIIVPRGTRFIDIGSGAGIPGIPLAIFFGGISGCLIESNGKKAAFIEKSVKELDIEVLTVINNRVEDKARDKEHREKYDRCFSRAFAKHYVTVEMGAPFLKSNGLLYVYSRDKKEDIHQGIIKHAEECGLDIMSHKEMQRCGVNSGLICVKSRPVADKYPRLYSRIKKDSSVFPD